MLLTGISESHSSPHGRRLSAALAAAAAIGIMMPLAVSAQAQQAPPQTSVQSGTSVGRGVPSRPLATLPQMPAQAAQAPRIVPFMTGDDPLPYAAGKAIAARLRVTPQQSS